MALIFAIFGFIHFAVFVGSCITYYIFHKKDSYKQSDHFNFIVSIFSGLIIGFFVVNHLAMFTKDSSLMNAIGYSVIPITQVSLLFLSYVIANLKKNLRYSPIFLGITISAPMTFLMTGTIGKYYWEFLGRSIYG